MRTVAWFLIVTAGVGCAQHGTPSSAPAPPPRVGIYRFTERSSQLQHTLEGRLIVTRDSVLLSADPGPCRYVQETDANGPIVYQCADVTYFFDRFDPVGRATYRAMTTVVDHTMTCTRSTTDASGRQTCTARTPESNERQVPVIGTLHLEAIAKPD